MTPELRTRAFIPYQTKPYTKHHYSDCQKIENYLSHAGKANFDTSDYNLLDDMWSDFSDDMFAAIWISVDVNTLAEFVNWLSEQCIERWETESNFTQTGNKSGD